MKETYLIIGSDSIEDINRIAYRGNHVGVNLIALGYLLCPDKSYGKIDVYKKGIDAILLENLSGIVIAKCSYKMCSEELIFWNYMKRLAKRIGLKVLNEWELQRPEPIDFDSLKNPSPDLHEKMLKITRAFKDAVQNVMDSEEEKDAELKACINGVLGSKSENRDNDPDSGYPNVFHIDDAFPGPDRPVVNINISIGGRDHSRGDSLWGHGSGCNDSTGGSRESRSRRDAPGCGCSSEPDGQSKISE